MAVVKFVNAGSPMNNIFDYVTRREATESKLIGGVNCSPESALEEFRFVKKRFHKEDGRSYYHIVQSFSPDDDLTPETAHEIGLKFAEYFPGFQVLVATHINTKAIESSIKMIKDIDNYYILIGGKYGVTCEEIDEDKLSKFLHEYLTNNPNTNLILTDELGKSLENKINAMNENQFKIEYIEDYKEAQNKAIENKKNILFIYRSNYSQVSKR